MARFVGRRPELRILTELVGRVRTETAGHCLLIRGRRRIGKSSLVEQFLQEAEVPSFFFTASRGSSESGLEDFTDAGLDSTLPGRAVFEEGTPHSWSAAFRLLAEALPEEQPSIVVIDEVPYLMDDAQVFEAALQRAWDRQLSRKPVLLLLVGSDLSMMEALNNYDRPFHQRGREMVIGPLNPADIADMLTLDSPTVFDAALVTGGLPQLCAEWRAAEDRDVWDFLERSLSDPTSPFLVSAERSLAAEFPEQAQARTILGVIASGERTFSNIARAANGIAHSSLSNALDLLVAKRIVVGELPVSTGTSRDRRYRVVDPYLRFWMHFILPHMAEIERMRGDITLERIRRSWTTWRGRAVEPLIRESLSRLLPSDSLPAAPVVGGYWTRTNDVEIDIVGADREPVAKKLFFVGSIKWLEKAAFDNHDLAALAQARARLTDIDLPLIAVSRSGISCGGIDASFGPTELLQAWRKGFGT
ncbi:MAG: ATP-binding protein [Longispora sp.]|nr:ATP-binding protein [Longispora sp. (in: high G+C Gram-positive bacteria)]